MDINDWLLDQSNLLKSSVDTLESTSILELYGRSYLIAIYDPFNQVRIEADVLQQLNDVGWMGEFTNRFKIPLDGLAFFDNPWIATKILRIMFTPNFYCFKLNDESTNALGIVQGYKNAEIIQAELKEFGLSSVIYSDQKKEGMKKVIMNEEPYDYKQSCLKPNHLKILKSYLRTYGNFPKYKEWFYKMERVQTDFIFEPDECKSMIARFQWSWMMFLLPIAADENNVSVLELTKHVIETMDKQLFGTVSLKMMLNLMKCHPEQIAGTTNHVIYGHQLNGSEMCFSYFKYAYDNSLQQWILQNQERNQSLINLELLKMWRYEHDWNYQNKFQKMVLEAYIYSTNLINFPWDIPLLIKANLDNIWSRKVFDRGKETKADVVLQLLTWLNQ